jgi:hypothetical protein
MVLLLPKKVLSPNDFASLLTKNTCQSMTRNARGRPRYMKKTGINS